MTASSTPLEATSVIRTVHHLRSRLDRGPTAADIAKHVRASEDDVLVVLRHLKAQRIFDDRRRAGERRWFPWEEVN